LAESAGNIEATFDFLTSWLIYSSAIW